MRIDWYFDFISPFAYLAWPAVRRLAETHEVVPRPILLAGLLGHHGQKGPAEIPGKREFTYRFVQFQAGRMGLPLRFPPAHPFNPLAALRLCVAAGSTPVAVGQILDWIWAQGREADSPQSLAPLAQALGIGDLAGTLASEPVKAGLRANFEAAMASGVFGVPTAVAGGERFWGLDALPMLQAYLEDPEVFARGDYPRLVKLPMAARREV
jgi:2-hydroxychromene-2-carboxylate isomerase